MVWLGKRAHTIFFCLDIFVFGKVVVIQWKVFGTSSKW